MATIQHNIITGSDLHVPGYKQASDPGSVGSEKLWIDTGTGSFFFLKSRNAGNTAWDAVNVVSASNAITASHALLAAAVSGTITSASFAITASFAATASAATSITFVPATASFANDVLKSSGGFAVTGSVRITTDLLFTAAAAKIIPGVTSLALRNNADNANNLFITDAGAVTFRSTVGGITTLTCTTVTATNLGGTLTTAAQGNITSVGTLIALTIGGTLTLTPATSKIVPGATNFALRNNADNQNNLLITDAGDATIRSNLTLQAAASKIVPGATSFALRNNLDNQDNLIILNAGPATFVSSVTGSAFKGDGSQVTGVVSSSFAVTASAATSITFTPTSASFADRALQANQATASLTAVSASFATNALTANSALSANTATSASHALRADTGSFADRVFGSNVQGTVATATSASFATNALTANSATTATSASYATTSSFLAPVVTGSVGMTFFGKQNAMISWSLSSPTGAAAPHGTIVLRVS